MWHEFTDSPGVDPDIILHFPHRHRRHSLHGPVNSGPNLDSAVSTGKSVNIVTAPN